MRTGSRARICARDDSAGTSPRFTRASTTAVTSLEGKQRDAKQNAARNADAQRRVNDALWSRSDLVEFYARRNLRPVEVMLLIRYREALSGRVLELGCGAGRLTGYLAEIASAAHGVDISPAMIEYCRRTYPRASFSEGDMRDLSAFETGSFDVIVASFNVLDVLNDEERRDVVDRIHRVLVPGGLLMMSTHNRDFAPRLAEPLQLRGRSLLRIAITLTRMPRRQRNRRRLMPLERNEPGYAILNDISHDFAALHYYIRHDAQQRQLAEHGFELEECLDLDGRPVAGDHHAPDCSELHYVARRRASVGGPTPP
jgi:SAM-dependent methyltransferase